MINIIILTGEEMPGLFFATREGETKNREDKK